MRPELLPSFLEELSKLAAVGVVHTHREARKQMKPGDIINMTPYGVTPGAGLKQRTFERVFDATTKALQGTFTHSAIYVGGGKVIDPRLSGGVKEKTLQEALRNKDYVVLRPKVPAKVRRAAARFARKQVGKEFDDIALLRSGAGLALPEHVVRAVNRGKRDAPEDAKKFYCSGLVSAAYAKAQLAGRNRKTTTPIDLRTSAKVDVVVKKLKKGTEEKGPLIGRARKQWKKRLAKESA